MRQDEIQHVLAEIRAVYAELAARPLERSCHSLTGCCQFQLTGLISQLTKAFRATGRKELPESADGVCPLFKRENGRCLIYNARPFGCRTHFCEAVGGPYPRKHLLDLIRRLEEVDRRLDGDGPRKIRAAIAGALVEIQ